jgi:glycyl-tRNA synthetase beta chain
MGPDGAALDPARLAAGAESALFEAMQGARRSAEERAARDDHRGALAAIASLRPAVDRFFDDVLVMDPDERVRANRLALLAELSGLLRREADFAEIVVEGEPAA